MSAVIVSILFFYASVGPFILCLLKLTGVGVIIGNAYGRPSGIVITVCVRDSETKVMGRNLVSEREAIVANSSGNRRQANTVVKSKKKKSGYANKKLSDIM